MRDKSVPHEVLNALQVGTDSEGGYLVPDEYERTLIESLEEENIFRRFAHIIRTSSGDRKIPIVVSKGTASWIDEEAAYPESDDAFGQTSISAYKLATMIKVSDELLHDSVFDVASYIAREFARRIGAAEEEAFFTGNGTGKPSFAWCFDGEPIGGTVAISSVGTQKTPETRRLFLLGYSEMLIRLKPEKILFFGDVPDGCTGNIERHTSFHAGLAHAQEKR